MILDFLLFVAFGIGYALVSGVFYVVDFFKGRK